MRINRKMGRNYKMCIQIVALLLIMLTVAQCQRGRGGGSSSGGRSSGGSSSWSSSRSSSGYWNRGGYNSYGGYGGGGAIAGYIIGGLCSMFCCCGLCYYCCNRDQIHQQLNNQGGAQPNTFNDGNDDNLLDEDRQFQRLRILKNKVSYTSMNKDQFQRIKNQFGQMISDQNSVFTFTQRGQTSRVYNTRLGRSNYQNQFLSSIQLEGRDQVGAWVGRGYIMAASSGPYVWWMKDYINKIDAGQVEASQFLIYESTLYNPGYWSGRWFFEGDEFDAEYSGTWSLGSFNPVQPAVNRAYQPPAPAHNLYYPVNNSQQNPFPANTYNNNPPYNGGFQSPQSISNNPNNPFNMIAAKNVQ